MNPSGSGLSNTRAEVVHNVLSLRAEADGRSEQVSQAIMGDPLELLEERGEWSRVRCVDGYEAWALTCHVRRGTGTSGESDRADGLSLVRVGAPSILFVDMRHEPVTRLVFGTPVKIATNRIDDLGLVETVLPGGRRGRIPLPAVTDAFGTGSDALITVAQMFVGTPYLWGGTTPFGFDCSGLVQRTYSVFGVQLPRDAYQQAACPLGARLAEGEPLRAGDLVFFLGAEDPRGRGITHVGMMVDAKRMIHASGRSGVVVEPLSSESLRASYTYRGAWRYVEPPTDRQAGFPH
ncbi:MAG TPA: C40 family peptidase [Chthonomonadaceae bacterium]|nr:C40 family peptidase [Chthonomonadaceae bacterium]